MHKSSRVFASFLVLNVDTFISINNSNYILQLLNSIIYLIFVVIFLTSFFKKNSTCLDPATPHTFFFSCVCVIQITVTHTSNCTTVFLSYLAYCSIHIVR